MKMFMKNNVSEYDVLFYSVNAEWATWPTINGFQNNGELGCSQTLVSRDNSKINILLAVIKEEMSNF